MEDGYELILEKRGMGGTWRMIRTLQQNESELASYMDAFLLSYGKHASREFTWAGEYTRFLAHQYCNIDGVLILSSFHYHRATDDGHTYSICAGITVMTCTPHWASDNNFNQYRYSTCFRTRHSRTVKRITPG